MSEEEPKPTITAHSISITCQKCKHDLKTTPDIPISHTYPVTPEDIKKTKTGCYYVQKECPRDGRKCPLFLKKEFAFLVSPELSV